MEISQLSFTLLVLYSVAGGFALGIVYDALLFVRVLLGVEQNAEGKLAARIEDVELPLIKRKLRKNVNKAWVRFFRDATVVVCDALFVIICGIVVILISYAYNGGLVRFAVILGEMVGFFLCRCLLGRMLGWMSGLAASVCRIFFEYLREIALCPVKLVKFIVLKANGIKYKRKGAKNETQ